MASTNDITDVVSGIVKEYIKPKYPIYKVDYIVVIFWDEREIYTDYYSKLVECIADNDEKIWVNLLIKKENPCINSYFVDLYQRVKKNRSNIIEANPLEEHWDNFLTVDSNTDAMNDVKVIVHNLERVA
jgi:hypothetical protein